jgi:23S rRNA (adenine-N6)-dimethyltransferase
VAGRYKRSVGAPRGAHFLTAAAAAAVAESVHIARDDLVVEFGAGYGRLTEQLARRAGHVVAVEHDARLAARLASRTGHLGNVTVLTADALAVRLPSSPFRVIANPPFGITAPLLGRLLDQAATTLSRADLVVAWGAALALTGVFGPAHKAAPWQARYEFLLLRRLPATVFEPPPSVDAALVSIRRLG